MKRSAAPSLFFALVLCLVGGVAIPALSSPPMKPEAGRPARLTDTVVHYSWTNHTGCSLGYVTFHFASPSMSDVTIYVPGNGTYYSTEQWNGPWVSVTMLGNTYNRSDMPASFRVCGEDHTIYYDLRWYQAICWDVVATNTVG